MSRSRIARISGERLSLTAAGVMGGLLMVAGLAFVGIAVWPRDTWSAQDLATLRSLRLSSLASVPADPSNMVADSPRAAVFGQALFFDTRFSANEKVSCATCH